MSAPFALHGVVHLLRPCGIEATGLAALRAGIGSAPDASLFYHAHHPRLRHAFSRRLPPDDFSAWAGGVVQDREAAERLSFAVQAGGASAPALRAALLAALPDGAQAKSPQATAPFTFLEVEPVRIDLGYVAADPEELVAMLCAGGAALFFHHVTEWPWLEPGAPNAAAWVRGLGEAPLAGWLAESAYDGRPLAETRRRLARRWQRSRLVHRIAEAAGLPEGVRQADGRGVVSRLVRQLKDRSAP